MSRRSVDEIINEIREDNKKIMFLYRWLQYNDFVGENCEKLCEFLLDNFNYFDNIPKDLAYAHEDKKNENGWDYLDYRKDSRQGKPVKGKSDKQFDKTGNHRRGENYLAMDIFNQCRIKGEKNLKPIDNLGYILDYEMPIGGTKTLLKIKPGDSYVKTGTSFPYGIPESNENNEKGLFKPGKCDLIAYSNNCFTILELKKVNSREPFIRAVLEAYTYKKMLDKNRATDSLREHYKELNIPDFKDIRWKAAPLLANGENQWKEYYKNGTPNLKKLMEKMEIEPIWYKYSPENKTITIVR